MYFAAGYLLIISGVLSVEPSSTTMSSQHSLCSASAAETARPTVAWALYAGMTMQAFILPRADVRTNPESSGSLAYGHISPGRTMGSAVGAFIGSRRNGD